MDFKKVCLISLFLLFLILSTSSAHEIDLDNSTDTATQINNNDFISIDENNSGSSVYKNPWIIDENGNIVRNASENNISNDFSVEFQEGNFTDLRHNNSLDNKNQTPINTSSSMNTLWEKYINEPWSFMEKYKQIPNSSPINWEKYTNNSCNTHYSKEFLDFMKFVNENKVKPDTIESSNINIFYSKNNLYKVRILNPVSDSVGSGVNVTFIFNNKKINVKTDSEGYASFKFNAQPGNYAVKIYSGNIKSENNINIKSLFKTKNVNKIYKKSSKFTVKLVKQKGKPVSKQIIKITLKGKNYKIKTNSKGIGTFKIPKNLKLGKYTIKTTYNGCIVKNKITVKK